MVLILRALLDPYLQIQVFFVECIAFGRAFQGGFKRLVISISLCSNALSKCWESDCSARGRMGAGGGDIFVPQISVRGWILIWGTTKKNTLYITHTNTQHTCKTQYWFMTPPSLWNEPPKEVRMVPMFF